MEAPYKKIVSRGQDILSLINFDNKREIQRCLDTWPMILQGGHKWYNIKMLCRIVK